LLEGSRWLEVGIIQTVDIQGGKLPPASFFDRVRSELNNKVRSKLNHKTVQLTAEEWFNSAYNKGESGDYQGAIADYNQAIKIKPDYALAYINRGVAKSDLGDKQGAIADYNQAAQLYSQQGNMEKYRKALDRIKNLEKGFWGRLFS
jgi:tetratricopeptide (TPR) repeat protein